MMPLDVECQTGEEAVMKMHTSYFPQNNASGVLMSRTHERIILPKFM